MTASLAAEGDVSRALYFLNFFIMNRAHNSTAELRQRLEAIVAEANNDIEYEIAYSALQEDDATEYFRCVTAPELCYHFYEPEMFFENHRAEIEALCRGIAEPVEITPASRSSAAVTAFRRVAETLAANLGVDLSG